jgi:hypothetical protein
MKHLFTIRIHKANFCSGKANVRPPAFAGMNRAGYIIRAPSQQFRTRDAPIQRHVTCPKQKAHSANINQAFN